MDESEAIAILSALAQPTRLAAFRQLIAVTPEGIAAGELASRLAVPQNTLSTHLGILSHVGLVDSARHGRSISYRAEVARLRALVVHLMKECCGGRPELCAPLIADLQPSCVAKDCNCA